MPVLSVVMSLLVFLVAVASPKPAATDAPNPFTLEPIAGTPLPIIGTTRNIHPVCTALRSAIAPALAAAMKNDTQYDGFKKDVYNYVVTTPETAKDFRLKQMENNVDKVVKQIDQIESALNSRDLQATPAMSVADQHTIVDIRDRLRDVLAAQKVQLDAMSGYVETEQMARMGENDESQQKMQNTLAQQDVINGAGSANTPNPTPTSTRNGFLSDHNDIFKHPQGTIPTAVARLLDQNLVALQVQTAQRESVADRLIVPAANKCK